jgi:hypothetical protein
MFSRSIILDFFVRVAIGMVIAGVFGVVLSEVSFWMLPNRETAMRQPERVDLVIPYGTSEQVKAGVYNRSLPLNLTFVQGDILVVKNEDVVTHQLGPMLVPAQTSTVMEFATPNEYSYDCTFQPTSYQGIKVLPRVNNDTRLQAVLAIALPTGMMLAVYSYLVPKERFPRFLTRRNQQIEGAQEDVL